MNPADEPQILILGQGTIVADPGQTRYKLLEQYQPNMSQTNNGMANVAVVVAEAVFNILKRTWLQQPLQIKQTMKKERIPSGNLLHGY